MFNPAITQSGVKMPHRVSAGVSVVEGKMAAGLRQELAAGEKAEKAKGEAQTLSRRRDDAPYLTHTQA